jgi:uncharacterized protein (TIRG00374 family)
MQNPTPSPQNSKIKKGALTLLGFALSGIALYFVFRGKFDIDVLWKNIERIRAVPLVLSIVFYWGGVAVIRSFLVRHLLKSVGKVRPQIAYRYICIGFLANNILPLRMGEAVRIGGIAKRSHISVASAAGGLVVERLMDLTMAALIGFIAIQLSPIPENIRLGIMVAGGGLLVVLTVLGFVFRSGVKETQSKRYGRVIRFIWNIFARFSAGFGGLGSPQNIIVTFCLAALVWSVAVGTVVLRLMAFDLEPSLPTALVLMAAISLGISVPSAPSGVGVFHWLAAQALIIMGLDEPLALSFAFFTHFFDYVSSSALGAVCMVLEGLRISDLRSTQRQAEAARHTTASPKTEVEECM